MLAYDLETTFLKKGLKREMTRILEVGIHATNIKYQAMVNPCTTYASGSDIIKDLEKDQKPESTLRFWTKLLVEKGHLESALKRATMEKQADAISILLNRSDRARKYKKPLDMLYAIENVKNPDEFVKSHKCLSPKGTLFYTTKEVLEEIVHFDYIWVAHNGTAFDSKIIKGNADRLNIPYDIDFKDSLPMFKRELDEASYSLPILYKSLMKKSYKAHHAYEDAKALYELVYHVIGDNLYLLDKPDLIKMKGVGKKSIIVFNKKKIYTQKDLYDYVATHTIKEFETDFEGVYRLKSLAQTLFSKEPVEKTSWRLV